MKDMSPLQRINSQIKLLMKNKYLPYVLLVLLELMLVVLKHKTSNLVELLLMVILLFFGHIAAVGDIKEKRIPNQLVGAMLGVWVLVMTPQLFLRTEYALVLIINGAIGFGLGGIVFLVVYFVSRKGLGGGDVKLIAVSGLYLGARGVMSTMLYGSVLAAIIGGILIATKRMGPRDSIPLAPFLYIGMLLTMFI